MATAVWESRGASHLYSLRLISCNLLLLFFYSFVFLQCFPFPSIFCFAFSILFVPSMFSIPLYLVFLFKFCFVFSPFYSSVFSISLYHLFFLLLTLPSFSRFPLMFSTSLLLLFFPFIIYFAFSLLFFLPYPLSLSFPFPPLFRSQRIPHRTGARVKSINTNLKIIFHLFLASFFVCLFVLRHFKYQAG